MIGLHEQTRLQPDLRRIQDPALAEALRPWDHTPDRLEAMGAEDWTALRERMHFLIDLFRSRQQAPGLLDPPFTPEQVVQLHAGRVPDGPL